MKKLKIFLGIIFLIGIIVAGYFFLISRKEKKEYSLVKVSKGNIIQDVSESGTVKRGEEIKLSFRSSEKIEKINIRVGSVVEAGKILAKLDTKKLLIQLDEALSAVDVNQAQLNKLLAGASNEEIKIAETAVANAQNSLWSAQQNLEDVKLTAKANLDDAYGDSLNVLDDAYLKSTNAYNTVRLIHLTYFSKSDQVSLRIETNEKNLASELSKIKTYLYTAKGNPTNENIDQAIYETKTSLNSISQFLIDIRQACEEPLYREIVSSTDKTSLDTQKLNINTTITNVTTSQQTISSNKITNTSNIDAAEAEVLTAEGNLNKARDELLKVKTPPRKEDIDLYQAKVKEAQTHTEMLKVQIDQATIISPTAGQITDIHKRVGETVQPGEVVISLIPLNPFQVEVDVYEEDIVKIENGNPVEIKLTAIPEKLFSGRVVFVDPAEKLIEGVVYYKVTIELDNPPREIKPGMTADVLIKTASRENVLLIPEAVIEKKNHISTVKVLKGEGYEERQIEIGLKGNDSMVEVISGLNEGEEIIQD